MDKSVANTPIHCSTIRHCLFVVLIMVLPACFNLSGLNAQVSPPVDTVEAVHPIPGDTLINARQPHDTLHSLASFDSTAVDSSARARLNKPGKHSPLKAGLFSAALPGLGQAYNKHYWKIPIVYAGFGGLAYGLYTTATNFNGYRAAYRQEVALIPNTNASYNGVYDPAALKEYRDYYQKYLDIAAIGTGVWYLLTIVDAVVDAHLLAWNMKDDISVSWRPDISPAQGISNNLASAGITFSVGF